MSEYLHKVAGYGELIEADITMSQARELLIVCEWILSNIDDDNGCFIVEEVWMPKINAFRVQ